MNLKSLIPIIRVSVPSWVNVQGIRLDREEFFEQLWLRFGSEGLQGIHEGSLSAEEAHEQGLEVTAWTLDSAEAPHHRDWMGAQSDSKAEMYFVERGQAEAARDWLLGETSLREVELIEIENQDWNAEWKASFSGMEIPPDWSVIPPWRVEAESGSLGARRLIINPGAGFGTGTHETTALCLQALARWAKRSFGEGSSGPRAVKRFLDFGSGSGILAIGAALMGLSGDAVEIDELAIDNARDNADLNQVTERIRFARFLGDLGSVGPYDLIFANILRPVLIEFAPALMDRARLGTTVILSGLIESDVPEVREKFIAEAKLQGWQPQVEVFERGEWRSIVIEV